MRWIVIILVVLAGWWGWRSVVGWYRHPSISSQSSQQQSEKSGTSVAKGGDYDLESVEFFGRVGSFCLYTSGGVFATNHMSRFGFVTGIDWFGSQPVVHCKSNTRREVFVLVTSPLRQPKEEVKNEGHPNTAGSSNATTRNEATDRNVSKSEMKTIIVPMSTPEPLWPGHLDNQPSTEMRFYNPQAPQINIVPRVSPTP